MTTADLIARAAETYTILSDESRPDDERGAATFTHEGVIADLDRRAARGDAEAFDYLADDEPTPEAEIYGRLAESDIDADTLDLDQIARNESAPSPARRYAENRAAAIRFRREGDIESAIAREVVAEEIFERLIPVAYRW